MPGLALANTKVVYATPVISIAALKIGCGGYVNGISIAPDGTKAVRTDVGGGYVSRGNADWDQVLRANRFPIGDPAVTPGLGTGLYEIKIAPSDSSRIYMYYSPIDGSGGYLYRSSDYGATWAATGFASVPAVANDQALEAMGPRIAIDPQNKNILIVGTPGGGAVLSIDGGTTFGAVISALGTATTANGSGNKAGHAFAFDTSSSVIAAATQGIYAATYGVGFFHSGDGGATWTAINSVGMPTTFQYIACAANGTLWVADNASNVAAGAIKKYSAGVWSTPTLPVGMSGVRNIAVNPLNSNEVVAFDAYGAARVAYSSNGSTFTALTCQAVAVDVPWLVCNAGSSATLWPNHMAPGDLLFDPAQCNGAAGTSVVYLTDGVGVWKCLLTGVGTQTFTSQSAGIEELVALQIVSPPGHNPMVACMDRPVFTITDATNATYPSQYGPTYAQNILEGYSIAYAIAAPATAVIWAQNGPNQQLSYTSNAGGSDGGPANWTHIDTSTITDMYNNAVGAGAVGGGVACTTALNWLLALSNGAAGNTGIWYTLNGGASPTWNKANNAAWPASGNQGWGDHHYLDRQIICADGLTALMAYAYNETASAGVGGIWRTNDGGATWTLRWNGRLNESFGPTADQFNAKLKAVPGKAGHLYFTLGQLDLLPGNPLKFSLDGGTTLNNVTGVTDVVDIGWGKAKSGSTYPTAYIYGKVGGVLALWQGTNMDSIPSWLKLSPTAYPDNRLDVVKCLEGDMNTYGVWYVGMAGTGALKGTIT